MYYICGERTRMLRGVVWFAYGILFIYYITVICNSIMLVKIHLMLTKKAYWFHFSFSFVLCFRLHRKLYVCVYGVLISVKNFHLLLFRNLKKMLLLLEAHIRYAHTHFLYTYYMPQYISKIFDNFQQKKRDFISFRL